MPEVAPVLGITEQTVKSHLHHIYEKTGKRCQADLVKLVAVIDRGDERQGPRARRKVEELVRECRLQALGEMDGGLRPGAVGRVTPRQRQLGQRQRIAG